MKKLSAHGDVTRARPPTQEFSDKEWKLYFDIRESEGQVFGNRNNLRSSLEEHMNSELAVEIEERIGRR